MKPIKNYEEFFNESAKCPPIYIPVLSNIDHTRIIKWMDIHFDSHKWDMKKSGDGFEIDVEKLSSQEQDDLLKYLHSQDYLEESVNEAWSNIDTDKAADLINKEIGVNPGYFFIGDEDLIKQFNKLWTEKKYKVALNLLIDIENLKDLKDFIKQNESVNEAVSPEVHRMVNKFVTGMADKYDYSLQDAVYAILDVLKSQKYKGLKESVNEGLLKLDEGAVKQFDKDVETLIKEIKRGYGWIEPEYVEDSWDNISNAIGFDLVKGEVLKRLFNAGVLYHSSTNGKDKGAKVTLSELGALALMR
jgi:hypothetical protein